MSASQQFYDVLPASAALLSLFKLIVSFHFFFISYFIFLIFCLFLNFLMIAV